MKPKNPVKTPIRYLLHPLQTDIDDRYNSKVVLRHAFATPAYLEARGFDTTFTDIIDEVFPPERQDHMWRNVNGMLDMNKMDWKEVLEEEGRRVHNSMFSEMRGKYITEIEMAGEKNLALLFGDFPMDKGVRSEMVREGKISAGIAEEIDMLQRSGAKTILVPSLAEKINLPKIEEAQKTLTDRLKEVKPSKLRKTKFFTLASGGFIVAKSGIQIMVGAKNRIKNIRNFKIDQ